MAIQLVEVVIQGPEGPVGPQGGGSSFVVDTIVELVAITEAVLGDLAYVTNDPVALNNGQYVANTTPTIAFEDWTKTQQEVPWGTITGDIVDQVDLNNRFIGIDGEILVLENLNEYDNTQSATDVDVVLVPGRYNITTGVSVPTGETTGVVIVEATQGSVSIEQRFVEGTLGKQYKRVSALGDGSDWSLWVEINSDTAITDKLTDQLRIVPSTGVSVDIIIAEGLYSVDTTLPFSVTNGDLEVTAFVGLPKIVQSLYDPIEGKSYTRTSILGDGSDWDVWVITVESNLALLLHNRNVSLGLDIDTFTTSGTYEVDNTIPGTLPSGVSNKLVVEVSSYNDHPTDVDTVFQVLRDLLNGKFYTRTAPDFNTPIWTVWLEIPLTANSADVIKYTDRAGNIPPYVAGQRYYSEGIMHTQGLYPDVTLQDGRELHMEVVNNTGVTILNGSACRHDGAAGGDIQVVLAIADSFINSRVLGVATHDILSGQKGLLTVSGVVEEIDTTGVPVGVPLYLSDTVAGTWSPAVPAIITQIGGSLIQDSLIGRLQVDRDNNIALPTISGFLQGLTTPDITMSTVATKFISYTSSVSNFIDVDSVGGTFTVPNSGFYRIDTLVALSGVSSSSSPQDVLVQVYTNNTPNGAPFPLIIGRNGTRATGTPFEEVHLSVGDVLDFRHRSGTTNGDTITFDLLSFSITSIKLDV